MSDSPNDHADTAHRAQGTLFDPFDILNLPKRFDVDVNAVQRAVLQRLARVHPDRQADTADPAVQAQAERESARLNQAKTILCDDEKRADTLVQLLGGPSKEEEKSLPENFLMEILETRERMEEALQTGNRRQLDELSRWAQQTRSQYVERTAELFATLADDNAAETLRHIRIVLNAWRYIERMIEQIEPQ